MVDSVWKKSNEFKVIYKHMQERKVVIENLQKSLILTLSISYLAHVCKFLLDDGNFSLKFLIL